MGEGRDYFPPLDTATRVDQEEKAQDQDYPDIDEMFEALFSNTQTGTSFHDFLDSVYEQYEQRGSLSPKQIAAIRRSYDNLRKD